MENALRACCKGIKIGKILIHREGDNGQQVREKVLFPYDAKFCSFPFVLLPFFFVIEVILFFFYVADLRKTATRHLG